MKMSRISETQIWLYAILPVSLSSLVIGLEDRWPKTEESHNSAFLSIFILLKELLVRKRLYITQIFKAIQSHESGRKVEDICREMEISSTTFYKWKQRYGGMETSGVKKS